MSDVVQAIQMPRVFCNMNLGVRASVNLTYNRFAIQNIGDFSVSQGREYEAGDADRPARQSYAPRGHRSLQYNVDHKDLLRVEHYHMGVGGW